MNKKIGAFLIFAALTFPIIGNIQPASAAGTVPPSIQKGIDDATATVGALDGIAVACLAVALTPLGAMLTLRFLNMVLARV